MSAEDTAPLRIDYKLRGDVVSRAYVIEYLSRRGTKTVTVCAEQAGEHCHVTIGSWVNGALKITGTTAYFLTAGGARLMALAWTEAAGIAEQAAALRDGNPVPDPSLLVTIRIDREELAHSKVH